MKNLVPALCGLNILNILNTGLNITFGEFETEVKHILGCFNLGPRGNRLMKKPEGRKSRDTVS
jgi:hypothetical protein